MPIVMHAVYALFTFIAPNWTFWTVYEVLESLVLYLVLLFINYAVGFILKCDNCHRPLGISPIKQVSQKQVVSTNTQKMITSMVPSQLKEKSFRCVHCGSKFHMGLKTNR
jgi:hypothetical protein